jgi:hypothetical protein
MSLPRLLQPELLDHLPADDPRAMRSRRDLRRINGLMANARAMAGALRVFAANREPHTILDLGSGDGAFMLRVARQLAPHWRKVTIILQDRQNIVSAATREGFAGLGWRAETVSVDVFEFLGRARSTPIDAITANLFLHHFTDDQLTRLFARAAELTSVFVACEPRRAKAVVELSRLLWLVGCNDVSVHDAVASARAGFAGRELSALWPGRAGAWQMRERPAALFTHLFAAWRPSPTPAGTAAAGVMT